MNRLTCLTVILTIVTACTPGTPVEWDVVITDSAGVMIVTVPYLEGLPAKSLVGPIVDLATSEDSADASFSRVSAVLRLADGKLIVADGASQRLKVFGPQGKYLEMLTGSDGTPLQVSAITAIWPASKNRIVLYDQRRRRVTTLSADGEIVRATDLSAADRVARPVGRLDDGDVLLRSLVVNVPDIGFELAHVAVSRFGVKGDLVDTVGIWPTARMGRLGEPPLQLVSGPMFEPRLVTAAAKKSLMLSDCRSAEFRVVDLETGLLRIIRWPTADLHVSEQDIAAYRARRLSGLVGEQQRKMQRMFDDMPVNPMLPACDRLRIDTDGRAWIRSYVRPAALQQEWLVFDPSGRPLFGIELPVAATVLGLGPRHVTVIESDTLNVQRVRVYEIE